MELNVFDPGRQFLLKLLEAVEVVQVKDHRCQQRDQKADGPQIGMRTLVVFKHDHAFTVAQFVLL